jgi:hypothetical protein
MANSIAMRRNYTTILDRVYQREAVSACLDSPRSMARAGRNAKEIMVPRISVTGLGDYTRNVGYKTGSIEFSYETKTFAYDRGIRLIEIEFAPLSLTYQFPDIVSGERNG